MTEANRILVYGLENGGVDLWCAKCETQIASGGCACCDNNAVTAQDIATATTAHHCKESAP
ncbi:MULTISPECIES: hypothetical protein [Streptomycetaceae]|uniref:hypothetical protein n=1 Tax=Streptomycetaceae TaxID=2062 RepID=UPI000213F354|nr:MULTISPECIES: hypothetical protein [Streptomycetaceae]MYS58688.1 hypothetical protein [Streptomyces sp. SID5468]CCB74365.1 protein of unknown function [Streptantibioticus cattleyicolor NRRL 8057 = DSM 46488]